jgi:drug/metabolite transporter (DMT)-like permease
MRKREITGFAVLCLLAGSFWIPKRLLLGEMPILLVAALWTWMVVLAALAAAVAMRVRWPNRREWESLLKISVLLLIVPQSMIYLSIRYLQFTPVMAETLRAAVPLFLVVMTPLLKAKSVPRGAVQWMMTGFGGVLLLFDQALQLNWRTVAGLTVCVPALLVASGALLYAKRTLRELSPVLGTGLLLVLPAVLLLPIGIHALHGESIQWTGDVLFARALLGVGGVLASVLALWLLQRTDAYRLMMIRVAVPVVMMVESWIMLGGRPGVEMTVATALILMSVVAVLFTREDSERVMRLFVQEDRRRSYTERDGSLNVYRRRGD